MTAANPDVDVPAGAFAFGSATVRAVFVSAACLSLFAPVTAMAQSGPVPRIGSNIPRSATERDPNTYNYTRQESDQEFASYGNCIVQDRAGQRDAAAFLALTPSTPAWSKAGQKLTSPECLRSAFGQVRLRYNLVSLRPALFAAMYRRRFGQIAPTSFVDEPALSVNALYTGGPLPQDAVARLSFANCVARTDAASAHRLLIARPWSDAEDAALPAVSDAMGKCLPTDQTLRMSRSTARGVVAEAMYHLASQRAARSAPADAIATKGR
ncbi:MAG: hypothetical protein V4537_05000 [Pseudomonadota bacterium]